MPQQYKIDKVDELRSFFNETEDFILTDYRGLSVEKITELRKRLRKTDSEYVVMKNNYIKVIGKDKGYPDFESVVKGPTAVAFAKKDISEVAKVLFEFSKESNIMKVKGGFVGKRVLNASEIEALSKLPGRNQLLAMLMSTMNAPVQNFVLCCNDVAGRLVRVLDQVAKQKAGA